eukprot:CAMPEP_0198666542 /NCGR_PEP_ID=MMETSP1467-20131203/64994_1 /TAXON_ID=1462469 /ORGANISM="unid. sp., Strain CCMP2135" /LENGTH=125 /DNA_ID=CAMNT_0044403191 /DNA_START=1 /DNA_END=378 /DNA_ORIENTATION=+
MAGGHVVENDSDLVTAGRGKAKYFYVDFPATGQFYYSYLDDLLVSSATSTRPRADHKFATMYYAAIHYEGQTFKTFRDFMADFMGDGFDSPFRRLDLRIGEDQRGTMYISSKDTGFVFRVVNSIP